MSFASDTFTDVSGTNLTAHTPDGGGTWAKHISYAADKLISDANRARSNSFNNNLYYHSGTPATAEYDVSADLYVVTSAGHAGAAGRIDTAANTFYLARFLQGTGWRLEKVVAGTFTTLGTSTADGTSLTASTTRALTLEIRDVAKKLIRDGIELLSSADNAITATGKAGLWHNAGSNTTGFHADNFQASDPPTVGGRPWASRLILPTPASRDRAWL